MRHDFFDILGDFLPLYPPPPNNPENQNLEKMREASRDLIILHKCIKNITIIWCMLPEIWSVTDIIFCHFGSFFVLFHYWPPKLKFGKNVKETPGDIILLNMCNINEDHIMYGSCDIRHSRVFFLLFWAIFCPFFPLTTQKIKSLEKMKKKKKKDKKQKTKKKKHQEISSFITSVQKIMITCYTVPEIWRMTHIIIFHCRLFFCPFTQWWCNVPEIRCASNGKTDGQTEKVRYRGGCPT